MTYNKTIWLDRAVQYPQRYFVMSDGGSGKNMLPPFSSGLWALHENTRMKQANFVGKVLGSTVENPHIARYAGTLTLIAPTAASSFDNLNQGYYDRIMSLDGAISTVNTGTGTTGSIAQMIFSFDLIQHVIRNYGAEVFGSAVSTADRVAWLKANVSKFTFNWWGYGSGPNGNKAILAMWNAAESRWAANWTTILTSTVSKGSINTADKSQYVDANGFAHFLAYADASNGTTASTINTDFVELEVYMAAGSVPYKDYELDLNATANSQISDIFISAEPNRQYTISLSGTGTVYVASHDASKARLSIEVLDQLAGTYTFTTETGTAFLRVVFYNFTRGAGTFTFINPQLELGSTATSFEPMSTYTIITSPGIVTQAGTPINATRLNNIENALESLDQETLNNARSLSMGGMF